jgi:hypothetical protein
MPSLPPALLIQTLAGTKRQQHAYHHSYFLEDDRLCTPPPEPGVVQCVRYAISRTRTAIGYGAMQSVARGLSSDPHQLLRGWMGAAPEPEVLGWNPPFITTQVMGLAEGAQ